MSQKDTHTKGNKLMAIANISVFLLILAVGGELSLTLPGNKISEIEKRELTPMPIFSWNNLFHGKYTDSLDLHYADNFPFRDTWVDVSRGIREKFGYRVNDLKLYTTDKAPDATADSLALSVADSVSTQPPGVDSVKVQNNTGPESSILIYKGMAFQLFSSSQQVAESYAGVMNTYRSRLDDSVRIFCLIAPTPIDYYLPKEYKSAKNLEGPNIEALYAVLDSGVTAVDAYHELERHKDEYIYFNTDHHWTGRGAYYAYKAFCDAAGFGAIELSQFTRKVRKRFLGSLYDMTKDARLKENVDSIETFRLPVQTKTIRYKNPALDSPMVFPLYREVTSYLTFLGGDFPLVRVLAENGSTKKALVVKDSYGNAMCPYLALHYKEVWVIDYRYFDMNLLKFMEQHKVDDVIFLHNTFVANTEFTVKKELFLLRSRKNPPELVKRDSLMAE